MTTSTFGRGGPSRTRTPSVPLEGPAPLVWWARRVFQPGHAGDVWPEQVSDVGEPHNVPTGSVLRARRRAQGLPVPAVAAQAGLTVRQVWDVEFGRCGLVSSRQRVSDALHVLAGRERP